MRAARLFAVAILAALLLSIPTSVSFGDDIAERARKLHFSSIVLDTHDDTTQRFFSKNFDLAKRNPGGHIDIPRMKEGGMNAIDRKSTRLNSSHLVISYAVFCLKKKKNKIRDKDYSNTV